MTSELEMTLDFNENLSIQSFSPNEDFIRKLYDSITQGNVESSLNICEDYFTKFQSEEFVEKIFKPTINKIKEDFESGQISDTTYHVTQNVSIFLTKIISEYQEI